MSLSLFVQLSERHIAERTSRRETITTNTGSETDTTMRPNIDISHTLNGRVKDYAEAQEVGLSEAYREVIEAGLEALEKKGGQ